MVEKLSQTLFYFYKPLINVNSIESKVWSTVVQPEASYKSVKCACIFPFKLGAPSISKDLVHCPLGCYVAWQSISLLLSLCRGNCSLRWVDWAVLLIGMGL